MKKTLCLVASILLIGAGWSLGGSGPQNVLVVVNDLSAASQELGHYYQLKRGIPERNICHVRVDPSLENTSWGDFRSAVVEPIQTHISAHGLERQIDYLVLSMDLPTRVNDNEGSTAVLFYGFKGAPKISPPSLPCSMPKETQNHYFSAERAFSHGDRYNGASYYLAMMLRGETLDSAKRLVDRGVAADGTAPGGTFYLLKPPGDPHRNIRHRYFDEFEVHARLWPDMPEYELVNDNVVANKADVMGYLTGLPSYPDWFWSTNRYLPGAMADHLTSFSAHLPTPGRRQSSILKWIEAGATATYGPVAEPCAMLQKFPHPLAFYWCARGFNLAESYWMSVANPYQGLFVGEPLAAPYATPPEVSVDGVSPGATVSGVVTVRVRAVTASADRPCSDIDMYIDGLWTTNLVHLAPTAWNRLVAHIQGRSYSYSVGKNESLCDAVSGLARRINSKNPDVKARALGDRVMLMDGRLGYDGTNVTCAVSTDAGVASDCTVYGRAMTPAMVDSAVRAKLLVQLRGTAVEGDRVACAVTLPDGVKVEKGVDVNAGMTSRAVLEALASAINTDERLTQNDGVLARDLTTMGPVSILTLEARTGGAKGYLNQLDYRVTSGPDGDGLDPATSVSARFQGNQVDLVARANLLFWCGRNPLDATFAWDTRQWPNGPHTLWAVAKEGTAVATQGHARVPVVVSNSTLTCRVQVASEKQTFRRGEDVTVEVGVDVGGDAIERVEFFVEDKPTAELNKPPYRHTWNTRDYGVGEVTVQAMAFAADGTSAVSEPVTVRIVGDTGGRGVEAPPTFRRRPAR